MPPELRAQVDALAAEVDLPAERLDRPLGDAPPIVRLQAHLAKAIALGPKVLLCEHPTASLDPADAKRFAETVRRVAEARGFDADRADRGRRVCRDRGDPRLSRQRRHRRPHVHPRLAPLPFVGRRQETLVRLLLFDIDGTLVLTGGAGSRAMARAFKETHGLDEALKTVDLAGRTDRIIIRDALTQAGLDVHIDEAELRRFRQAYVACLREEIHRDGVGHRGLLPGVRPLLEALSQRDDVRLALLTGNFRDSAEIKLAAFDVWRYFAWGAFADDAIERDDLIGIAHARHADEHGAAIAPDAVVIIGDTPHDIRCARAGGAKAVAVATGKYDLAALERHAPDVLFKDLTDTEAVLQALLG